MPDDSSVLGVEFRRNDYGTSGERFIMKADKVDRNMSNSLVTKSILSAAGDIAGKDLNLGTENYSISGPMQDSQTDTYPAYQSIDTNVYATATEKEINLAQAMRAWGPDLSDGFDRFIWGPRDLTGMMSKYTVSENPGARAPEQYDYSVEWVSVNVFIGD